MKNKKELSVKSRNMLFLLFEEEKNNKYWTYIQS